MHILAVDKDYPLHTLHRDSGVLSCLMTCVSSVTTAIMLLQSRAALTLGVRMCSTSVTRGPLLDAIRPNSGIVSAVLLMSNVHFVHSSSHTTVIECTFLYML